MRKTLWTLCLGACLATTGALAVACGDDDNAVTNTVDSGTPDGAKVDAGNTDSGNNTTDGGDGGCSFPAFVINLINTQTTASATPSTDLGDGCTDNQDQADFASLFQ